GVIGLMLYVLALGMNPLKLTLPVLPWDAIGASIGGSFASLGRGLTRPFRSRPRLTIARREPRMIDDDLEITPDDDGDDAAPAMPPAAAARVNRPQIKKAAGQREQREAQQSLKLEEPSEYQLPPLNLLEKNKNAAGP